MNTDDPGMQAQTEADLVYIFLRALEGPRPPSPSIEELKDAAQKAGLGPQFEYAAYGAKQIAELIGLSPESAVGLAFQEDLIRSAMSSAIPTATIADNIARTP